MAKILILSGFDDNMAEVGIRCTATHRAYAEFHGYDHEVMRQYEPGTHPSWQKVRLLRERIASYDIIVWLDADSLITNFEKEIGPWPNCVLAISSDWCAPVEEDGRQDSAYVSCGNFILYNTPDTAKFLQMWEAEDRYARRAICCWEQDALRAVMMRDEWFNSKVYRLPRKELNSVHRSCVNRNFPEQAPMPWMPGNFILHLTNVDRLPLIAEHDIEAIKRRTDYVPEWHETGNCADLRHISWLHDVLKFTGCQRTLEVGIYSGSASSAFIQAGVPHPEFCDIHLRHDAKSIIGTHKFHQKEGRYVIAEQPAYDLVFVDGNHALNAVEPEVNALLANPPRIIAAHDVNSTVAGFGACEGAHYLWQRLQQEGWMCIVDAKDRPNEMTKRGMMFATKDPGAYAQIVRAYRINCW